MGSFTSIRWCLLLFCSLYCISGVEVGAASAGVTLEESSSSVTISNGIVSLTLLKPSGKISKLSYGPLSQVFAELPRGGNSFTSESLPSDESSRPGSTLIDSEYQNAVQPDSDSDIDSLSFTSTSLQGTGGTVGPPGGAPSDRGYYDSHWLKPDGTGVYDTLECTSYKVITNTAERVTVAFARPWGSRTSTSLPADVELRFSVARGSSGFYSYALLRHDASMPACSLGEFRLVMKLRYQRVMPEYSDRSESRSAPTPIAEARILTKPHNPDFQLVYGWVSNETTRVGIWAVNPSKHEYAPGGVTKQDLTVQTGPYLLNYLHSSHIGTPDVTLEKGQEWSKTYGPFFYYLNQADDPSYDLQRAAELADPYLDVSAVDLSKAWVGLAALGRAGSWAEEVHAYQFWISPDGSGAFSIEHVRPGSYNLYAFVPGVLGDYRFGGAVSVAPGGGATSLGQLYFQPPRLGPTLWEIGVPDRSAQEFYVPVMNPKSPYPYTPSSAHRFRNYAAWLSYRDLYPSSDLLYEVGTSDYATDWFYAQPNRLGEDGNQKDQKSTTWTVVFPLYTTPAATETYKLRFALAGENYAAIQVRVNSKTMKPLLDTVLCNCKVGFADNGMARAAAHGQYNKFEVSISGALLVRGKNSLYLTQRRTQGSYIYVMYDYLRLEGPPTLTQ
eukprot:jgi/Mesen1/9472/ME000063S08922